MERCPNCRARLKNRSVCGRCGMDFELLLASEAKAEKMAQQAVKSLLAGNVSVAEQQATAAMNLHGTDFHRALVGYIRGTVKEEATI